MKTRHLCTMLACVAIAHLTYAAAPAAPAPAAKAAENPAEVKKASTLANLQAAYNGESNAKAKYEAFAKKADEEGYAAVAALFRAAAVAEGIHAAAHAKVIKSLKAEPQATIVLPDIKSTKENLEAALGGENYERLKMYPEFIALAKHEGHAQAVKSFTRAMKTETEHAKLYQTALNNLESWKAAKSFLVCPVCGYTTDNSNFKKCPICSEPRKKFTEFK